MDNVNQEASLLLEDLKQKDWFDVKTMEDDLRKVGNVRCSIGSKVSSLYLISET